MSLRFAPPEPEPEGLGVCALVLALIATGVLSLVALEEPGATIFVGLAGLFVLASAWGQ